MHSYALGLDFGTLSVRALFLDLQTGQTHVPAVFEYPHGVMRETLPDGTVLPPDFALEHPQDFRDGLVFVVRNGMKMLGLAPEQVVGIGVDVTSATVLPVDEKGEPLCLKSEYAGRPQAWMKLWSHHAAGAQAQRLQQVAMERKEPWLSYYGGWINSELLIPKAVELAQEDPETFEAAYTILDAADWIVWELTGQLRRSAALAGCNSLYRPDTGFPSRDFFQQVGPEAARLPDKLKGAVLGLGECAGGLLPAMAEALGLVAGTPVAVATIDSHAAVIGCGGVYAGDVVSVIGTSAIYMLNSDSPEGIEGVQSCAWEANVPGLYGLEAGQNCVGEALEWFVCNCVPQSYTDAARAEGKNIHQYLTEKAAGLKPGESGLLALDWFHGVRAPLMDFSLTATLVGLTAQTRPEEIYRALLEAVAFGGRRIVEQFLQAGLPVKRILAAGGIPNKNPLMMQILADVLQRDIYLCPTTQGSALGSALLGAAVAGETCTKCKNLAELAQKYTQLSEKVYHPREENVGIYRQLYAQYLRLSEQMSAMDSVCRKLRALRMEQQKHLGEKE